MSIFIRFVPISVLFFSLYSSSFSKEHGAANYTFNLPDKVKLKSYNDPEMYNFSWGKNHNVFILALIGRPLEKGDIVKEAKQLETRLKAEGKNKYGGKSSVKKTEISKGIFSGFQIETSTTAEDKSVSISYMFVFWDGNRALVGLFNGHDINVVYDILEKTKKK